MKYRLWKVSLSFILALFASLAFTLPAFSVPVDPTPHTVEQSDGTFLTIRFLGDEFISWQETLYGDVIAYNEDTNNWYYAYIENDEIAPGNEKVAVLSPLSGRNQGERITADDMYEVFASADYYRSQFESNLRPINLTNNRIPQLVMLLEFSDRELSDVYLNSNFPTHTSFWSNEFFGNTGKTVNTYFEKVSHDFNLQFTKPSFTVENGFRVDNPTQAVHSLEIRDNVVRARVNRDHPNPGRFGTYLGTAVTDAFAAVKGHIDLSGIPRTDTGAISSHNFMVSVVVAGYESSTSGPAQPGVNGHARGGGTTISAQGQLWAHAVQGELAQFNISATERDTCAMGIGVIIHEIGHVFGLPDLYSHTPFTNALGNFSVMCMGSHTRLSNTCAPGTSPSLLDPWSKTQLGFIEPTVIDASEHRVIDVYGMGAQNPYNVVQVISDADSDQYFLIENRRLVGFDTPLRSSSTQNHGGIPRGYGGILIYHIDERVVRDERLGGGRRALINGNSYHRGVELETMTKDASGNFSSININPFFTQGGLRYAFSPTTTPNSNFHTPGLCNDHRHGPFDCHPQTVVSGIHVQVNSATGQVIEVEVGTPEDCCPVVAEGRLPDQVGGEGLRGAAWELCECGVLTVSEGFIHWNGSVSPWNAHRTAINEIVFTGPITAGESLHRLFMDLFNVTTIKGLEYFDTSDVTNMSAMFRGVRLLADLDLSTWDTSNVADMSAMFNSASSLTNLDVSNWNTARLTTTNSMFGSASSLISLDVSGWDTSNVANMAATFGHMSSLTCLDVSGWDTSNVTTMSFMFDNTSSLADLDLSHFDTSNVTTMQSMFSHMPSLTSLNVSGWNTSRVTSVSGMFQFSNSLASLDLSSWDMRNVRFMDCMFRNTATLRALTLGENFQFRGSPSLPTVPSTDYFTGYWQNVGVGTIESPNGQHVLTSAQLMTQFRGATMADTWVWQPVGDWCPVVATGQFPDQVGGEGLRGAAWALCECGVLTVGAGFINWGSALDWMDVPSPGWGVHGAAINEIVFTGPITAGESLHSLFRNLTNLTTIEGLDYFDTSNVRNMNLMFSGTTALTNLDISSWDTGNVRTMDFMFHWAEALTSLDISNWDTGNVTSMSWMFSNAKSLTSLDISNWDTGNVTNMHSMFGATIALTDLDVSNWDTSNVRFMNSMFSGAKSLTSLDVSNWDTGNVRYMGSMFIFATALTDLDVSNWDTGNVADMSGMFVRATALTYLDLSNWDISNVERMDSMFRDAESLTYLDLSNWDISNAQSMGGMFAGTNLVSLDLSSFETDNMLALFTSGMLYGTYLTRALTLGENFGFPQMSFGPIVWSMNLPPITPTDYHTGYWQNVGSGTIERPNGQHVLTSAQLMEQFDGATMADTWVWQPVITECPTVAEGNFPNQAGASGIAGATWQLCECGVLTVDEGFINWTAATSPWHAHRADVTEIEFTGTITAGMSLTNLFRDLSNVETIKGLENFDTSSLRHVNALFFGASSLTELDLSSWNTSSVLNTANMFNGASSLTSLDLSNWDTGSVTNMGSMFQNTSALATLDVAHFNTANVTSMNAMFNGASALTALNLSNWDTRGVTNMNNMLWHTASLSTLVLGENFEFRGTPNLPVVPSNGRWQNVGSGTVEQPGGEHILTSAQLMSQFNGATMADTWVWQPR